jgi:hemoglobin
VSAANLHFQAAADGQEFQVLCACLDRRDDAQGNFRHIMTVPCCLHHRHGAWDHGGVPPVEFRASQQTFDAGHKESLADRYDQTIEEREVYAAIGAEGFERLVAAFYRQVPGDDVLAALYPAHDLAGAEKRLRDFLIYRFGGPATYIEERGHPRLRMRHRPFRIGPTARECWLQLMDRALTKAAFPAEAEQLLREFFASTATFLMNQPEHVMPVPGTSSDGSP